MSRSRRRAGAGPIVAGLIALAGLAACQVDVEVGSNLRAVVDAAPPDGPSLPACRDRVDNDGDDAIDFPAEPGCLSLDDDDETDPGVLPACSNGDDDDGDAVTDYPTEPGCAAASDPDELDPAEPPQCADGADNDGNDLADYPADTGCYAAGDPEESSVVN